MEVTLKPGQYVDIKFAESDGAVRVAFGHTSIRVHADLPDDKGRVGTVYHERFGALNNQRKREKICDNPDSQER